MGADYAVVVQLQDLQLQGDIITYGAAVSACEKGSQWTLAVSLLEDYSCGGI